MQKKYLPILIVIFLVGVLAFPVKVECGVPGFSCATPPNESGEVVTHYDIEPFGVKLMETVLHENVSFTYSTGFDATKY